MLYILSRYSLILSLSFIFGCSVFDSEACKKAKEELGTSEVSELKRQERAGWRADSYYAAKKELQELKDYMQTEEYKNAAKKSKNLDSLVREKLSKLIAKVDDAKMDVDDSSGGPSYELSYAQDIKKQACGY